MGDTFKVNNFDLVRLAAALLVVFQHTIWHLGIDHDRWFIAEITVLFPGVPIFFFVSGFLISRSYESNSVLREYAQNRIFRIYPALIVCTVLALASVYWAGYGGLRDATAGQLVPWIAGQVSFVQFYNPAFMREFGTGVLNGALWTISVELQFYVLVPVLYWLLGAVSRLKANTVIIGLIALFAGINAVYNALRDMQPEAIAIKLLGVSFAPWFYMFLIGVLFQRNFEVVHRWFGNRFIPLFAGYVLAAYAAVGLLDWEVGNKINVLLYIPLAIVVFSLAYSAPSLGNRLLRRNDISYGIYIYHIPIINLLMYYGYMGRPVLLAVVFAATALMAALSWILIEHPSLKLKSHPLNPF